MNVPIGEFGGFLYGVFLWMPAYLALAVLRASMGDSACYRDFCPVCECQVTIVADECPECGEILDEGC